MPEFPSEVLSLGAMLEKITRDLRAQMIENRIEMVEAGYIAIGEDYFWALRERSERHPTGNFLKLTPDIERALRKAAHWHQGQKRKDPGRKVYYMAHLLSVAEILSRYQASETAIIAGLLHDTVEDTGCTFDDLQKDFGPEVTAIVKSVSESDDGVKDRRASWLKRKTSYLQQLGNASDDALLVSGADKIHNLVSLKESYQLCGDKIWAVFNSPPDKKLWFYEEVLKILNRRLNSPIVDELSLELERMRTLVSG